MSNTFSVKECIAFGWNRFKERPGLFVAVTFVLVWLPAIINNLVRAPQDASSVVAALAGIIGIVMTIVGIYISMGLITFALAVHENAHEAGWKDAWAPHPFWKFLLTEIMLAIVVIIGFILLIVPGIILSLGLSFVQYLVMDRGIGYLDAMKESWRITKGHKWQLLGLFILLCLINILGFVCLIVGTLVTIPLTWFAMAHAYRVLEHQAHEIETVPAAAEPQAGAAA
ncbi:MAG TPA: hypothetical protein VFL98_02850 [Candidatus Paceibacterota bacterium]|nr:hypothetical protein [Candidatus Paceibacterota bacterium]